MVRHSKLLAQNSNRIFGSTFCDRQPTTQALHPRDARVTAHTDRGTEEKAAGKPAAPGPFGLNRDH